MNTRLQRFLDYLNERFQVDGLLKFAKKKTVPEHPQSFWYYFGGISLFLTGIQIATGLMLLLYYTPSIDAAHESVQFIMGSVKFGWLIRSVHSWTANILIGILFVHMFSTYFLKAYRKPRELTWMTGFVLFVVFLAFGFSGYLLPWNELSYFATRVGTDIVGSLPLIGKWLKTVVLGGPAIGQATLSRFFWFHVAILPLAALAVIFVHVWLVQSLGMSKPIGVDERKVKEIPFFPDFIYKDALAWTVILVLVGVVCVFLPWEVGKKADPFAMTPLGIKPEWYFTFMFTTLKVVPGHVLFLEGELLVILALMVGALFWLLAPYIDRKAARGEKSPLFTWIGIAVAIYIAVFTALTYTVPKL
jgi:quinol-cytochrome oxidoreductase complex cytochrome b subunit